MSPPRIRGRVAETLEMRYDAPDSKKWDRLERYLDDPRAVRYWLRVLFWPCKGGPDEESYDGTLRCSPEKIADHADYEGDPAALVAAMVRAKLLDEKTDPDGTRYWVIHNFSKRNPHVATLPDRIREAHEAKVKAGRASAEARRLAEGSAVPPGARNDPRSDRTDEPVIIPETGDPTEQTPNRNEQRSAVLNDAQQRSTRPNTSSSSSSSSISDSEILLASPPLSGTRVTGSPPSHTHPEEAAAEELLGRFTQIARRHGAPFKASRPSPMVLQGIARSLLDPATRDTIGSVLDDLESTGPPKWWRQTPLTLQKILEPKHLERFAAGSYDDGPGKPRTETTTDKALKQFRGLRRRQGRGESHGQ